MVSIDYSVIIQIVNFIILIWILNMVLYKPIRGMLSQRKEKVVGIEQGIENLESDAVEKDRAFHAGIREARANGLKEKEKILQQAGEEEQKIIEEITQRAQAEIARVRENLASETQKVRSSLMDRVDEYANAIGEKILGRAM